LGFAHIKAVPKHVGEINRWSQFYQPFTSSFCGSRFTLIFLAHSAGSAAKLGVNSKEMHW